MTDETKGDGMTFEQLVSDLEHQRGAPLTCDEFQISEMVWQAAQSAMRVDETIVLDRVNRYNMQYRPDWAYNQATMMPSKDGEYVKFEDVRTALQAALAKE